MNKRVLLIIVVLFSAINIYASQVSFRVDSIIISGNNVTNSKIILQELTFSKGDSVNAKILDFNKERIYSLNIFTDVKLEKVQIDSIDAVLIKIKESWYYWPIPFINKRSNSKDYTYGMEVLAKNFRGRNETLDLSFGVGYDPFIQITYVIPTFLRGNNIGLAFGFYSINSKNVSDEAERLNFNHSFYQRTIGGDFEVYKRHDLFCRTGLGAGFENSRIQSGDLINRNIEEEIKNTPKLFVDFTYDNRDLIQFPTCGNYFFEKIIFKGFGISGRRYAILNTDYRYYKPITDILSLKLKLSAKNVLGDNIPYYDKAYLGSSDKIRGYYYDYIEGKNYYVSSFELRIQLHSEENINFNIDPIPSSLTNYRIKTYLQLFFDSGTNINEPFDFNKGDFKYGYGASLNIMILPYNAIRLEYAINKKGKGEFILGTGFSF